MPSGPPTLGKGPSSFTATYRGPCMQALIQIHAMQTSEEQQMFNQHKNLMCEETGQATATGREENCFAGGMARKPICPTPPFPVLGRCAGRGVWAGAALLAVPGGGGSPTPTSMAQNDPHVALIILTTHMWGKFFREKNFSGPKFVFGRLWWQHPSLHKTKRPARKPISGTPPPPSPGAHATPPPPAKQFSGRRDRVTGSQRP